MRARPTLVDDPRSADGRTRQGTPTASCSCEYHRDPCCRDRAGRLVNCVLNWCRRSAAIPITLQRLFAYVFRPVMWLIGIPGPIPRGRDLMATKTVLNEFVAYVDLSNSRRTRSATASRLIMTYAICGFANFGSLGIPIGGMGAMAPQRRRDIVGLGLRSILSGTLATCMSGAVVGVLL